MATITKSYTFSAGATILASEHNTNLDTLYNWANGNVDNANIKAGAGISLSKLSLGDDVTFTGDFNFTNASTTDDIVTVTGSSLTTGSALKVYSNSSSTSTRNLVEIINDHSDADAATCLQIQQDGDATGISIAHNGDGSHLNLSGDPTNATPVDGDIWFDGSDFKFYNGTDTIDLTAGKSLGDWVDARISGTIYQAETDGFVMGYGSNTGSGSGVTIVTDSNATPTTIRVSNAGGAINACATCPVKKDDYYKVTVTGTFGGIFWIPLS
jgi:hypothetical protein